MLAETRFLVERHGELRQNFSYFIITYLSNLKVIGVAYLFGIAMELYTKV